MKVQTDVKNLLRDSHSKAVLETDISALESFRAKKQKDKKIQKMSDDICSLKEEINTLKSLLQTLIQSLEK